MRIKIGGGDIFERVLDEKESKNVLRLFELEEFDSPKCKLKNFYFSYEAVNDTITNKAQRIIAPPIPENQAQEWTEALNEIDSFYLKLKDKASYDVKTRNVEDNVWGGYSAEYENQEEKYVSSISYDNVKITLEQ